MNFDDIQDSLNPVIDVDVIDLKSVYHIDELSGIITNKHLYNVGIAVFPQSDRQIYLIDDHNRLNRGYNKVSLATIRNPLQLANLRQWYPAAKNQRDGLIMDVSPDQNQNDIFRVVSTIDPKVFFEKSNGWADDIDELFYQGFKKDSTIANTFKCCMIPLPFKPKKWQRFNNHTFLFTQTKTGKTGFTQEVLGQSPVTEPSVAGLAGGILGKSVKEGILQGTGFCMLDEINATDTEVFDLILNLMEQGVGTRGKVGVPSCQTTKTIMFAGNPEDDVPELLAMDFNAILSTLTNDGANIERVSGRLGLFLYGIEFEKAKQIVLIDPDKLDVIRGVVYDTLAVYQEKYEKFLEAMTSEWLFLEDREWEEKVEKLSESTKDQKIHQFIRGWKNSVDNMRMAALRWTLLEMLDTFIRQELEEFKTNEKFKSKLQEHYDFIKDKINFPSLEQLTHVELKLTFDKFKEMILRFPRLKTKSERELQRLFGVGSHHTIRKWLERVDSEVTWRNEQEAQMEKIVEHSSEVKKEIDDVIEESKKNPPKKPWI